MTLAFDQAGAGPATLMIHGFPLSRAMWQAQLTALAADGYRALAPDLPGFGESPSLAGPVTMTRYAEELIRLLDRLEIERAAVCGMSMGGYVLFSLLEHFPERVAAAGFIVTRAAADDAAAKQKRSELAATARSRGVAPVAEVFSELVFAPATARLRPELVEEVRGWMLAADPEGVAGALEAMRERGDYATRLADFTHPALVVGAQDDRAIPVEHARKLGAGLGDAELVEIDQAGHMVNLEQPQAFNDALLDFLRRRYPA